MRGYAAFSNLIGHVNFFHELTARISVLCYLLCGTPTLKQLSRKMDKDRKKHFTLEKTHMADKYTTRCSIHFISSHGIVNQIHNEIGQK